MQTQPLEISDFSRGITDYFLDGLPNDFEVLDNIFLRPNRKPITRWGSQLSVLDRIAAGSRISKLAFLRNNIASEDVLLTFANTGLYTNDGVSWTEVQSPTSNSMFDAGDANSLVSCSEWRGHLLAANSDFAEVQKVFFDDTGTLNVQSAGLPFVPTGASIANPPGAGSTYSYLFLFRYEYKVGNSTNLDRGPKTFFPSIVTGGTITTGNGASITTIPTTLPSSGNYDTANLEIEIYRTQDADADYFLVGTVPFGTTSFLDEVEDADLATNTPLYSISVDYKAPPQCKYVHVVNNIGYYAHVKENNEVDKYRILQSIPGDADSVPPNFIEFTEQEITGFSSIFDRPIVLCTDYIYRIDQFIDSTGAGIMDLRRIDDRAGCVSNSSIVRTHRGMFWAGKEGFYWTDGFKVKLISKHINETYASLVDTPQKASRIYGSFDPSTERISWSVTSDEAPLIDCDKIFVLDLKFLTVYDGEMTRGPFTVLRGGSNFSPTATITQDENLFRADSRGYLFIHNRNLFSDPVVDTTKVDVTTWFTTAVLINITSASIDFGSKFLRKFVPRMLVSAANLTNLSLAISSSNDNNRVVGDLAPIIYKQNINWGNSLPVWSDSSARWNQQGIIEEWRRFPARGLRCQYKKVTFTNASVEVISSDVLGQVNINSLAKTITLDGAAAFPANLEGYNVQLSASNFNIDYEILSQSGNTLVVEDTSNDLVDGIYSFKIVGIPKDEILELNGYVLHWAPLSKTQQPFTSGGSNG